MSTTQRPGKRPGSARSKGRTGSGFSPGRAGRRSGFPVFPVVIGAVVVLGVVAVVLTASGDDAPAGPLEAAPVTVEGAALPAFTAPTGDPAVGTTAPTLRGEDFDGTPVVVEPDGRKKALVFLVHTCPHCDAEAPDLAEWVDDGNLPDGVDLYVVATNVDRNGVRYPPSRWLAGHGLGGATTLLDSEESTAAQAYGMRSFPYWVFLDEDNEVVGRLSGRLGQEAFTEVFGLLAAGEPIGTGTDAGPATAG